MIEEEEYNPKEENNDKDDKGEFMEGDERNMVTCVIQQVLLTPKHAEKTQRHKIFKPVTLSTRCVT